MKTYYEPCFYSESRNSSIVMHYEMRLKDEVDGEILNWAVQYASQRYPYFRVRVDQEGESLVVNPNPLPLVVRKGIKNPIPLCSVESNYHVAAVIYEGNTIFFELSHMVSDGQGRQPWVRSILYYYLTKKYGVELDSTGINLVDTPLTEEEYGNPFPESILSEPIKPFFEDKHENWMKLIDYEYAQGKREPSIFFITFDEKDFMKFTKESDGSPATICSVILAKAIYNVHKEKTVFPIQGLMCQNHRPGLNCPKNYHFLISAFKMGYPERSINYDVATLSTITRGQVMLNTDPKNSLVFAQRTKAVMEYLESLPTLAEKRAVARREAPFNNGTFIVSYVGKINYGCAQPYIAEVYPHIGLPGDAPLLEINAMNGKFNLSLCQNFKSDVYAKAFVEVLQSKGIQATLKGPEPLVVPIVDLD